MRVRNLLLPVDGFCMSGEIAPLFIRWSLPHWAALGVVALAAGGSCGAAGGSGWKNAC